MEPTRVPQELVVGWNDTLVRWTAKESHDTLLGRAVKHNQLAWVATRYREAARSNPYDPIARDRLKAVQRAAAMLVFATPLREPVRKAHSGFAVLLMGLALSTVVGLWAARYVRDHRVGTIVSRQP
jgi:hypothetical protein